MGAVHSVWPAERQSLTRDGQVAYELKRPIRGATHRLLTPDSAWNAARLDWATLLRRVYDIDALACPCGGRLRFVQLVTTQEEARPILIAHGLSVEPAVPRAEPPQDPSDFYDESPSDDADERAPRDKAPKIRPPPRPADDHLFVDDPPADD